MNTVRCKVCKLMFSFDGLPPDACPPCKMRKESQYQEARQLVKDNPGMTALEVHEITGIPLISLAKYIEAGYFEIIGANKNKDMDVGEVQIWVNQVKEKTKKSKLAKQEEAKKAEILPDESDNVDEPMDTPAKKKHGFQERW